MDAKEVRIVHLDPMRVASAYGFGSSPENTSSEKLYAWMQQTGLDKDLKQHRFFGFNNPSPTPGSPNYGYEQWITVSPGSEAHGEISVKDVPEGLYAVSRCALRDIGQAWQALVAWCEDSPYHMGESQCLEECLTPEVLFFGPPSGTEFEDAAVFDLYLPIISQGN